jgi:hypothetical protein
VIGSLLIGGTLLLPVAAQAQEHEEAGHAATTQEHAEKHYPNQLLGFLGGTWEQVSDEHLTEKGFTFGLEYVRELNERWAFGGVVERAGGDIRGTLLIAQLYFDVGGGPGGVKIVTGPGVEFRDAHHEEAEHHGDAHAMMAGGRERDTTVFVYRIGVAYDIKIERWIIAPTIDWDFVGRDTALVAGVLAGYEF